MDKKRIKTIKLEFDAAVHMIKDTDVEFWYARELMKLLGYERWENFEKAVNPEDEKSMLITRGLGGKKNISDVDCCATRLRCTVVDPEKVKDAVLKQTGPSGIIKKGQGIQIIYGPSVSVIKSNLEDYLETAPNEEYITENAPESEAAAGKHPAAAEAEGQAD